MKTNFKSIATKTMIASAIASMMAGAAFADPATPAEPTVKLENSMTISSDLTIDKTTTGDADNLWGSTADTGIVNWQIDGGKVSIKDYYLGQKKPAVGSLTGILTIDGGTIDISATDTALVSDPDNKAYVAGFEVNHIEINGGTISLSSTTKDGKTAASALGAYDSFEMNGGTINIGADAMVWMTTDGESWSEVGTVEGSGTMKLNGGTINISGGKLAAGDDTADDTMLLAGTNVNVNAEKSKLEANTIEQTAGTIHVTKGDLTIQSAYTTKDTSASYKMTGGAIIADAGTNVTFETALTASDNARIETTDGQIRLMQDAAITGGTINLTATAENLKANDGKGYFDGVGLIVGDQNQEAKSNLTLGSTDTNLVANVKDGAHIDSFGKMTINGGTFNVGGSLNGSVNNDAGMGQAWRQGSQIYAEGDMTITGGNFNLGQNALLGSATSLTVSDAVITMNGTKDAISMIGAWGASSLGDGAELNVNGTGLIKLGAYAQQNDQGASFSVAEDASVNVADGATLVVTRTLEQFYDTPATGLSKGLITVPDGMTGLVVTDGTFKVEGDVYAQDVTVGTASGAKSLSTGGTLNVADHGYVETATLTLANHGAVNVAKGGELYVSDKIAYGIDTTKEESNSLTNAGSVYANLNISRGLGEVQPEAIWRE